MHRILSLIAAFTAVSLAADISGTWYCTVELPVASGSPTFTLKQQGNKVTGTYSGTLGDVPVTGTVDGDKVELTFEAETAGQKFKVTYEGAVKNEKEMAGKVTYGEFGEGTFTATKKE